MFVIILKYIKSIEEVDKARPLHLAFLKQYYATGHFLLSGRQTPVTGGVILAKAKNKEEVEKIIEQDPFYKDEIATFTIYEFNPNLAAPELESLIDS